MRYVADDGTEFETERECREYEQGLDKIHSSMIMFDENFDKIDVANACHLSNACYLYVKGNAEKVGLYLEEWFGFGEGIYKSGMYIVDEEEARWNFIDNLIEQYRNNIEKLITIKREIIRRNK